MLKGLLGFFGRAIAVKNNIVTLATYIERAGDDTDGDGKSQLENITDDLKQWGAEAWIWGHAHFLDLERILEKAKALGQHIKTGD